MKNKTFVLLVALFVLFIVGVKGVAYNWQNPTTSNVIVTDNGDGTYSYDLGENDGVADGIVDANIEKTMAANNVAAIVFDFRGYDTLGESFILLTAIAGSFVILARAHKEKKEAEA